MQTPGRTLRTALITFIATAAAALLVLNFTAGEPQVRQQLPRLYGTSSPQFERAMGNLLGPSIVEGNDVMDLQNGDRIFPPMLAAIRAARRSITFETYIYWSGDIGKQFADALSERARAGVKVHVLLDCGAAPRWRTATSTRCAPPAWEIEKFHKPHWYNLARLN